MLAKRPNPLGADQQPVRGDAADPETEVLGLLAATAGSGRQWVQLRRRAS